MILVTGATGTAGAEVVRQLTERRARVRAYVRDAARARGRLGDGVDVAVGELADARALREALAGIEVLVLSCADDPRRVEWETRAIDLAVDAGVRRIVRLSTVGARPGAPVAFWDWHGQVDRHLAGAGVGHVILHSAFYMSNLLAAAGQVAQTGRLLAPAGGARVAMIHPGDVGAAAAAAATGSGEDGTEYTLTGPEAVTYEQVAAELATATRSPVEFVDVPEEAALEALVEDGMPEFVARQFVAVFRSMRGGAIREVTDGVRTLTGVEPRGLDAWLAEHAAAFAQPAALAAR